MRSSRSGICVPELPITRSRVPRLCRKPIYIHTHYHFFQKNSQKLLAIGSGMASSRLCADRNREREFPLSLPHSTCAGVVFKTAPPTASGGGMVQHLIASDRTITELARRMEVTQQAMSKIVAELIRLGILETASAGAERIERICLSKRGRQWVQLGRRTRARIEARLFEIMKVPS